MADAPVIKLQDVRTAIKACNTAAKAQRAAADADEVKKAAMLAIWEPMLGVKSTEEVARYSREEILKLATRRFKKGEFAVDGFELRQLFDVIQQTQCRRNVSWKEELIAQLGESKATEIQKGAAPSYSYKFSDVPGLPTAAAHAAALGGIVE